MPIIMLIIAIAFAVFWCYQFIFLMMMEDDLFPQHIRHQPVSIASGSEW
jgi:hypothetical protein